MDFCAVAKIRYDKRRRQRPVIPKLFEREVAHVCAAQPTHAYTPMQGSISVCSCPRSGAGMRFPVGDSFPEAHRRPLRMAPLSEHCIVATPQGLEAIPPARRESQKTTNIRTSFAGRVAPLARAAVISITTSARSCSAS